MAFDKLIRDYLCPATYPTNVWYRNNLERNYDCIVLGNNTMNLPSTLLDDKKVFNMSLNNQTLLWDFYVLKQFFSILKVNGIVYFTLSEIGLLTGYRDVKDKRPYYFDFMSYVFSKKHWHIIMIKILKNLPILMLNPKDVWYLLRRHLGADLQDLYVNKVRSKERQYKEHATKDQSEHDFDKTMNLIKQIKEFCMERSITPILVVDCSECTGYMDKIRTSLSHLEFKSILLNDKNK